MAPTSRAWIASAILGVAAGAPVSAQLIVNGSFYSAALPPWVVTPTPGGASLATTVMTYDIDGPGILPASSAAQFLVGRVAGGAPGHQGVEVTQPVQLLSSRTYTIAVNWSVKPLVNVYNQSGGRFELIVDGAVIATADAPPTTPVQPSYGVLTGDFQPAQSGAHQVGVRITRDVPIGEEVFQYLDNADMFFCYGDCNNDGVLNVAEWGCFQTRWVLREPWADCNHDGTFTIADFGCWRTVYVIGCPP